MALSSAISLCICLQRGGVAGLGLGQRLGDLGVEPLLGLGDLLGNGRGRRDRAAFARRLGNGLERGLELRDAVGKIGKLRRGFLDAGLQGLDLGLELRQRFGIAGCGFDGFELRDARFQTRQCPAVARCPAAAKAAPGQSETDNADQAAEHARGEMGDEAFQFRNAGLGGR